MMPTPSHTDPNEIEKQLRTAFISVAMIVFLIQLLIETSKSSEEKYLGVNVCIKMFKLCIKL